MESITPSAALQHEEFEVPAALKPFVARCMRTWSEEPVDLQLPLPPTGSLFLTLVYGDPMTAAFGPDDIRSLPRLFIGGQLRNTMPVTRVRGRLGITGFEFTPTGFYRLFQLDCRQFTDTATPLETVLPVLARAVEHAVDAIPGVSARMARFQSLLGKYVPGALPATVVDESAERIEQAHGCLTVAALARQCHLSERQLNRRFLREVGIGPKHFAKVVQLKQALAILETGREGEMQALAQRAGYFDQAHFIKDFQRFIGTNPLAFLHSGASFLRTYMKRRTG